MQSFFDSCGACRYATCATCNVQHACDEPSLLRPHGVCVIIFPTAPSEFCIISIYKLFQRVGKSCTNKGRKNPTRSIKQKKKKKPSPSQAPQTENLISQLISIWNNLELQQIRSGAREAVGEAKDAVGARTRARARAKGPLKQSRAKGICGTRRAFAGALFALCLPLATCWVARNCVTAQHSGWAVDFLCVCVCVGMVRPATRSIKSA